VLVPYRSTTGKVSLSDITELCFRLNRNLEGAGVSFQIFVLNQVDGRPFNRGALVNAAVATLGRRRGDDSLHRRFDYVAIHDVDRFPVATNSSGCANAIAGYYTFPSSAPRVLHPTSFAGGVLLLRLALFRAVNGFANAYWGWGEEDNDLFLRLRWCGLPPQHAERIDWCMEHRDCTACRRAKRNVDSGALRGHEQRMRSRMQHVRRHMLRDGLSTLNFSLASESQRLRCGPIRVIAMDVDLRAHGQEDATGGSRPKA
jgi:xylosylprotein 4-beta-galactosyltransferase